MPTRPVTDLFRGLPAEVRALSGVGFLVALGFGLVAPALPLFARDFGVDATAAGAVVSAFALARLICAPFVGRVVDRLGENRTLALGIGIVAVSSALAGLSRTYVELLVLRGVGGVGSIMFSVAAASLLVRATPSHLRGRAQGVWSGSFLIGLVCGPAVGTLATFSLRLPFFLYAVTLVAAGALGLVALRDHGPSLARVAGGAQLAVRAALRQPAYRAALAAGFAGDFSLVGARSSLVPQFITDDLGLRSGWVYVPFLIVSVVSGVLLLPAGRVADTAGRRPVMVVGLLVGAVGLILMPAVPSALGVVVGAVLIGVGAASDSVAPGAVMGDVVGAGGGTVVAVFQMAGDLGAILGPVVCGLIVDHGGYGWALLVAAAVCAAPVTLVALAPETLQRPVSWEHPDRTSV